MDFDFIVNRNRKPLEGFIHRRNSQTWSRLFDFCEKLTAKPYLQNNLHISCVNRDKKKHMPHLHYD